MLHHSPYLTHSSGPPPPKKDTTPFIHLLLEIQFGRLSAARSRKRKASPQQPGGWRERGHLAWSDESKRV